MSSLQQQDHHYIRPPKWREGKVRPIPGNPPHDRLVGRGFFSSLGWFATIPSTPLGYGGAQPHSRSHRAFLRYCGIYRPDRGLLLQNLGRGTASRWSGPRQVTTECDGWSAPCPSSAMSSDRLFLDRVARQHCPSLLHRHAQTITHFPNAPLKPEGSTLLGIGTFYFALTKESD